MRSLISIGILGFVLTFCNFSERLKQISSSANSTSNSSVNSAKTISSDIPMEKPTLTDQQQAVVNNSDKVTWTEQGVSWQIPKGWKKMDEKKETFNFSSPDNAFLLVNISPMADDFPSDASTRAFYDQAVQQLKNGKYEKVRYLEIDGVKGVEWVEAMPEEKDGPRRHQWIGYRNYLGQKQMLNVMLSTKGTNFEKHRDDFPAIMYSMKIPKG